MFAAQKYVRIAELKTKSTYPQSGLVSFPDDMHFDCPLLRYNRNLDNVYPHSKQSIPCNILQTQHVFKDDLDVMFE